MFSVGLTGGIASGKTTISDLFAKLQVPVVDTDIISRKLLEPGELAYDQVRGHFGASILNAEGKIDRARLREIVFTNQSEKSWLETMLHPLIYQRSHDAIVANADADYVLVVIPLLFETNFQALVDRILVVDCLPAQQIERLVRRDHIDESLALKMLSQQLQNSERIARAHDIIDNRSAEADLESQVEILHNRYLELSRV
ncbi:MAG: Dephospho-CoA kinase (EC 2.7.1.24) [Olavius algarvensis Gamma 3 endosymbiont]|nr:MAG: Dephospho-CoA kinase (EC 2.7.1.24) [Olavius algarvensis Gamma 3 endosymbiont]